MKTITLTINCGEYNVCDSLRELANYIEDSELSLEEMSRSGLQGDDFKTDIKISDVPAMKYYQPEDMATGDIPGELFSYQVFPSKEEAVAWLENNSYDSTWFDILEYQGDDIEGFQMIDQDGNIITTSDEDFLNSWFGGLGDDELGEIFPGEYEHTLESADPEVTLDTFYNEAHAEWTGMDIDRKMDIYKEMTYNN